MIDHLLALIRAQLASPFVTGGFLLMITGSVIALARSLPGRAWSRIKSQFVVEVEVASSDPLFDWISLWLNDQPYSKRTRRLIASTIAGYEASGGQCTPVSAYDSTEEVRPRLILSPSRGMHLFRWRGKILWLTRGELGTASPEGGNKLGSSNGFSRFKLESYTVRVFGRSQETLRNLLSAVIEQAVKLQEKKISAFVAIYGDWRRLQTFTPRKLDSVILPAGVTESILEKLKEFVAAKEWYLEMGIPYHLGFLFKGTPGSGKTSVIGALAGELRMNLYLINLANEEMDDERFASLINYIPPRSFMVLEDIDAALAAHKRTPEKDGRKGLTLTGLLNSLDGFMAKDGAIVFMTTNHPELLDPALTRPGRVDMEVAFEEATEEQKTRMFKRFFREASDELAANFGQRDELRTMAEAQQWLIEHKDDPWSVERKAAILCK